MTPGIQSPTVKTTPRFIEPPTTAKGGRTFDHHKLSMVPRSKAASAASLALFQLQDIPSSEEQVLGVAVLYATLCHKMGLDPADLHTMAMRVLTAPDEGATDTNNAIQSLRDFAGIHLMGRNESFW